MTLPCLSPPSLVPSPSYTRTARLNSAAAADLGFVISAPKTEYNYSDQLLSTASTRSICMASDRMRKKTKDYAEIFGHIMRKHALIMRKLHRIMRKLK